ncbi:MAG: helix-turn-helix transcriptional regulator [Clostridia bacterium]|nr:helix-turn-helix transcriptional regulator [Clostridia bacterium]
MKLKEFRIKLHLTQQQVADSIGINQRTYSGYENEQSEPSIENLIKLAKLFGVSVDTLIGNDAEIVDITLLDENRKYLVNKIVKQLDDIQVGKLIGYMDK